MDVETDIPLQHSARDCDLESHTDLKNRREKLSEQRALSFGNHGFDSLSHVGYTELKISSDSESEFLYSDDDDAKVVVEETHVHNEVFVPHTIQPEISLLKLISDCLAPEMLIGQTCAPVPSFDIDMPHDTTSSNSSAWTVSVDDDPSPSNFVEGLIEVSRESLNVLGSCDIDEACRNKFGENFEPRNAVIPSMEPGLETIQSDEVCKTEFLSNFMDLSDSYNLVIGNNNSANISEDLKLLFSQISSARGLELSTKDTTLQVHGHGDESMTSDASSSGLDTLRRKISIERNESGFESLDGTHGSIVSALQVHGHGDESKTSDASCSSGLDTLQEKISIERNESDFESLDGSIVSEIEGEGTVDRLKRQVEHDRKSMSALYKELEEERNASAIAANEAMAMITRLQEEKASLHLEALQNLRMMEEQAEYDVEALQKANDLLSEWEKDIQDLEAELEFYQNKLPDGHGEAKIGVRFRYFDDEKYYISQCLKMPESKLNRLPSIGVYMDASNDGHSESKENGVNCLDELHSSEAANGETEMKKDEKENSCLDLISIENEVLNLNERLEALKGDRNFLEHAVNSLRNSDEGVRFIEEIAHHLRDLCKVR
ncbi:hypothetical protein GIB67_040088 [Kingdonia uniflora]|uniref:GTD-binding domain-containing protein n=1 Tax=Kingdonia uniflora TaxID=39325 RepID=A0A7J7MUR4_9MAGN|nr:hypothetical protein GIB67_040088 [Kingdonia uniflora]